MAAKAELRCRLLLHRDEMSQWRWRPSENAEDAALSSWPARGTKSLKMTLLSRVDRDPASRHIDRERGGVHEVGLC